MNIENYLQNFDDYNDLKKITFLTALAAIVLDIESIILILVIPQSFFASVALTFIVFLFFLISFIYSRKEKKVLKELQSKLETEHKLKLKTKEIKKMLKRCSEDFTTISKENDKYILYKIEEYTTLHMIKETEKDPIEIF